MNLESEDSRLLAALQVGDTAAFETIYQRMAEKLLHYVDSRVHNREQSEEIVQEIFVSLWVRRQDIDIHSSIDAYLYAAAKYQLLNYIRSESVRQKYAEHFSLFATTQSKNTEEFINLSDLKATIEEHVARLPPKCQQVFRLSRFTGRSIQDIADEMSISTRTVENYITQALKHLRQALSQYPWIIILMVVQTMR